MPRRLPENTVQDMNKRAEMIKRTKARADLLADLLEMLNQRKIWDVLNEHEQRKLSNIRAVLSGNRDVFDLGGDR